MTGIATVSGTWLPPGLEADAPPGPGIGLPKPVFYPTTDTKKILRSDDYGATWDDWFDGSTGGALDDLADVDTTGVADGDTLVYDSGSGLWVPGAGGGSAGSLAFAEARRASTDLNFNTTGWQNVDTALDLTIAAAAGDKVIYSPNFTPGSTNNTFSFDVATIVSAAIVNYFCTGTSTPAGSGLPGWRRDGGTGAYGVSGGFVYTVQAGDVSSGTITMRLRINPSSTTSRVISATATTPLIVQAWNLTKMIG